MLKYSSPALCGTHWPFFSRDEDGFKLSVDYLSFSFSSKDEVLSLFD